MKQTRIPPGLLSTALWVLLAACMAAFFLQMWMLPGSQGALVEEGYRLERETVLGLAGGLLERHPELEEEIAELLRDGGKAYQDQGAQALAKYGYHLDRPAQSSPAYRGLLDKSRVATVTAALAGCGAVLAVAALGTVRYRRHMAGLEARLERYCSGQFDAPQTGSVGKNTPYNRVVEKLDRLGGQIRLNQERLEEEKEGTKSLVTDISHQLKTPIAALKTCFALYLEAEDAGERQEFLERSQHQMDKLERLTGSLMNISRLETAMITLRREPVSLEEILIGAVNGVYHKARAKGIALELEPGPELTLFLDRNWTVEAVMNILDNAVKYSPQGTRVLLTVERLVSFVRVEIRDQGPGVPREEQNHIFQRFYRGGSRVVQTAEGAGVGLYLTRSILEQQGGTVHVRPGPAGGSVFVVQLPL